MAIYKGRFTNGITHPVGLLLYPEGDIYFGQMKDFLKHGMGKQFFCNGSHYEGTWDQDKMTATQCKFYDSQNGNYYIGSIENSKKNGKGKFFDAEKNEIYEGSFQNDKKQGEGLVYKRNRQVIKGEFRNDFMEGGSTVLRVMSKVEME